MAASPHTMIQKRFLANMNKQFLRAGFAFLLISFVHQAKAQISLPRLIRDSMVLQRGTSLKLWGWASPGEKISIKFNGKTAKATTGSDGKWMATLPPMKAGGPY